MADLNVISITGRLTRDAVIKNINTKQLMTFGVANNIGFGQYEKTNFYTVNMWGDRGLKLCQYLKKGTSVGITGQESLNEWIGNDSVSHSERVINAHDIVFVGGSSKKQSSSSDDEEDGVMNSGMGNGDYPVF